MIFKAKCTLVRIVGDSFSQFVGQEQNTGLLHSFIYRKNNRNHCLISIYRWGGLSSSFLPTWTNFFWLGNSPVLRQIGLVFSQLKKWPVFLLALKVVKLLATCKRTQRIPTLFYRQCWELLSFGHWKQLGIWHCSYSNDLHCWFTRNVTAAMLVITNRIV